MNLANLEDMYKYMVVASRHDKEYFQFWKTDTGKIMYNQFRNGKWYKNVLYYGSEEGLFQTVKGWPCLPYGDLECNPLHLKISELSERFTNRQKLKEKNVKDSQRRAVSVMSVEW